MKITIEELRRNNPAYAYGADALNASDLRIVNDLIQKIEGTRTDSPQTLDNVAYTDKYGSHYPHAMIESDVYSDGLPCIVQHASAHVGLSDDGSVYHLSSGGSYDGGKNISNFRYIGKHTRTFWTWSSVGPGASHGIFFSAAVSCFEYADAPLKLK